MKVRKLAALADRGWQVVGDIAARRLADGTLILLEVSEDGTLCGVRTRDGSQTIELGNIGLTWLEEVAA